MHQVAAMAKTIKKLHFSRRDVIASLVSVMGGAVLYAQESSGKRILIICTGNSARSQMTAGFLHSFDAALQVFSAGTAPAPRINPLAVQVMKEVGIDISGGTPKNVNQFVNQAFDYVITVCDDADKNCPRFSGKVGTRAHIGFLDPAKVTGTDEQKLAVFRQVRDEIRLKFKDYYAREIEKKG